HLSEHHGGRRAAGRPDVLHAREPRDDYDHALAARRRRSPGSSVSTLKTFICALGLWGAALPAAAQVRWPAEGPPRPLSARDVTFPPYEMRTLPNGLQVVAVLHHEQPAVSIRMIVRAGSALDPKDKLGLARLAASLLDQ